MRRILLGLLLVTGCWTGDEPPPQSPRLARAPVRAAPPTAAQPTPGTEESRPPPRPGTTPPPVVHVGNPAAGRQVYDTRGCAQCHALDGSVRVGPSWKGIWGTDVLLEDGRKVTVDDAYVRRSILEPRADTVIGFPPVMPTFRGQLTGDELDDVVAFIASLKR